MLIVLFHGRPAVVCCMREIREQRRSTIFNTRGISTSAIEGLPDR
jgi:hypothetical protein